MHRTDRDLKGKFLLADSGINLFMETFLLLLLLFLSLSLRYFDDKLSPVSQSSDGNT